MSLKSHAIVINHSAVETDIPLDEDYRQLCISTAKELGDKQDRKTNLQGFMTSYTIHHETDVYNSLLSKIACVINSLVGERLVVSGFSSFTFHSAWVGIYNSIGDYAKPHKHDPSFLSFCYYLQASEDSSPLVFTENGCSIQPSTGKLVVFPSDAIHEVPPQSVKEERVIFAGNLKVDI